MATKAIEWWHHGAVVLHLEFPLAKNSSVLNLAFTTILLEAIEAVQLFVLSYLAGWCDEVQFSRHLWLDCNNSLRVSTHCILHLICFLFFSNNHQQ